MTYISFPGLGIDAFRINPVAFKIFGHPVMWYGVIIAVGMVLAFFYALSRAKIEKIKSDDMIDLAIYTVIFSVIGARLYYVAFSPSSYFTGSFWENLKGIVAIWNGGLAIYGAVIAGFITIYFVSRYKKIRFSTLLDVVSPAVMIGQIIGRWGNFVNAEAYGGETESFIRMGIHKCVEAGAPFYSEKFVHPTFLYESLWNLVGFIIIASCYKKKKFNGQVFLFYMSWYGLGRTVIEGLRTDSLYLGSIRISQLVAALTFIAGVALMIYNLVRISKMTIPAPEGTADEIADSVSDNSNNETSVPESASDDANTDDGDNINREENNGENS